MRLVDVIEQCHLSHTPDEVVWQIAKTYTPEEINKLILIYLKGLDIKHHVPGKLIWTLGDISNDYQEYENMTHDQKILVIGEIIKYWDQMSVYDKAKLML